jgi:hydroxyethylthiazole kinase
VTALTPDGAAVLLARVRERRPLVHHITNMVTVNDVANVTLALGASPVMAHAPEEVEEMVSAAGALVLNLGTLTQDAVDVMVQAGRRANREGIPVILDPVGAGATAFRTVQALRVLAEVRVACVRGNAGEIAALSGTPGRVRGVDATGGVGGVDRLTVEVAGRTGAVIAATGAVDFLSDGQRGVRVENGHPMLARITGSGCMATAAIGAFAAVERDTLAAAAGALLCFEVAAENAAAVAGGPGTFRAALLDALAGPDGATVRRRGRLVEWECAETGGST